MLQSMGCKESDMTEQLNNNSVLLGHLLPSPILYQGWEQALISRACLMARAVLYLGTSPN